MKLITKITLAAIAAFIPMISSVFAGENVGDTSSYTIQTIQVGNGQSVTVVYRQKPATTVALNVRNTSVGSASNPGTGASIMRQDGHGHARPSVTIPGGIN